MRFGLTKDSEKRSTRSQFDVREKKLKSRHFFVSPITKTIQKIKSIVLIKTRSRRRFVTTGRHERNM